MKVAELGEAFGVTLSSSGLQLHQAINNQPHTPITPLGLPLAAIDPQRPY